MTGVNRWTEASHAEAYREKRASIPQRDAGMSALMEWVPSLVGIGLSGPLLS